MWQERVSFRVLGPVGVRTGGSEVVVGAPSQQALLAQLLLRPNETLSASALIDGIYGVSTPRHPDAALQIVVSRLRRTLGTAGSRLVSDRGGYRVELGSDELDLTRARELFARGVRAMRYGDMAPAAVAFDAALDCWSGEPLAELSKFSFHEASARRLAELQVEILERRNDAYLQCGRHAHVLADIELWIAKEPWREPLRGHQMLALYRAGRQIEALAVYEAFRQLMVEEFGVDPSPELQQLHRSMLRQEPHLAATYTEEQPQSARSIATADTGSHTDSLIRELRAIADNILIVDSGPSADKTWLVVDITGLVPPNREGSATDLENRLPRVALSDVLSTMTSRTHNADHRHTAAARDRESGGFRLRGTG